MEGLRDIATISYKQWSQKEKNEANEFFCKLDSNEDGKVSFKELRDSGILSERSFFKFNKFDVNGNKVLDFEEVLILYFYKYKANSILTSYKPRYLRRFKCNGCGCKQTMPDFSCFFCLDKTRSGTYNLCHNCYCYSGAANCDSKHKHEKWCLLNQESLGLLKEVHYMLNEVDKEREYEKDDRDVQGASLAASIGVAVVASACTIM